MAGVSRLQYSSEARLIRVMCSGRVDLEFVLRAFSNGMDGVFIGGCRLNECNYVTHGNFHALNMTLLFKRILGHMGLNPERLKIEFMSSGEGILFGEAINSFSETIKKLGPLGSSENLDKNALNFKLASVKKILPYLKLVQSEKLGVRLKNREEHAKFFADGEITRLIEKLVVDKIKISQIMLLLKRTPRSPQEISRLLGLNPSEISKYLSVSTRQGLIMYDAGCNRYAVTYNERSI
jgi:F420-non-reducing hydrogenase iron-sulfur subunit